jgi:type III secretion protein L
MELFSLLSHGNVHLSKKKKILPAAEFSQLVSASALIERAQESAATYREEVDKECAALKVAAEEEGFSQGLERWSLQLIHFDEQIKLLRLELQKQILPIALKAAQKMVADQLTLEPTLIVDIVMQAMTPALHNRRFVIYVNKADKEILEAHKARFKERLEHMESLTIQERGDVSSGGCIIETEKGIINASVERMWAALEKAFMKYMTP